MAAGRQGELGALALILAVAGCGQQRGLALALAESDSDWQPAHGANYGASTPPAHGTFTVTGSMTTPRSEAMAVLLRDGRVLVVGGPSRALRRSCTGARLRWAELGVRLTR